MMKEKIKYKIRINFIDSIESKLIFESKKERDKCYDRFIEKIKKGAKFIELKNCFILVDNICSFSKEPEQMVGG